MIELVYQELITKRSELVSKLNIVQGDLDKKLESLVKNNWEEFTPSSTIKKRIVAVDGGEFVKELRTGIVFVLNAEALITEGVQILDTDQEVKAGVFRPGNRAKERVGELMAIMELKLALQNGSRGDWILMDGSLKKKLGEVRAQDSNFDFREGEITSLSQEDEDIMLLHMIYEKQVYLSELLKRYGSRTVWISKVSRTRDLFHHELSDITLLETFTSSPGFSTVRCRSLLREEIQESDLRRPLDGIEMCSFYARLDYNENVLRIDVIGRPTTEFIKGLLNDLYSVSVKGYPYPLVRVHYDVKVSGNDRRRIIEMLNLRKRRSVGWWPGQFY
ncbi:hypothetical protein HA72_0763 [Metallosphaera sedula]|uniref:NurA domain-containing protein n=3 Tax=Metallosphaera TaxID=41980 RepID=A4YET6_METS5|nr:MULTISPECIES: DNA double-strand break repair nuclease NurA [Metallosphaera]ABP94938.1 conserved hypothetical protein [Metallosphaera sedula DSM 5348]AIM26924.1 hypothetical protein HA72_0763 [Metallosphaera sedula]AKV73855.1 hypothetical protein MsedA_0778 [Metallosphaera sedula]AKV76096.1 hypothetical protein MsedB_0778 [Metallosphaera sedula]AKV78347.1 hypothetical protein MsedC_0777 [Metallosphaera sedula]